MKHLPQTSFFLLALSIWGNAQTVGSQPPAPNPHIETIYLTQSIKSQADNVEYFLEVFKACKDCEMFMVYDFLPGKSRKSQVRRVAELEHKIWSGCGLAAGVYHRYYNPKGKAGTARLYVIPRGGAGPEKSTKEF